MAGIAITFTAAAILLVGCHSSQDGKWNQSSLAYSAKHTSENGDTLAETITLDELNMKLNFRNIESNKIKNAFTEVLEQYDILHPHHITLRQRRMRRATMQAKPVLAGLMRKEKRYEVSLGVYVKGSDGLRVDELPEEVLVGWFAHELGHLVDYERFSKFGMLRYGARYVSSRNFKREAEHQADLIAVNHGFQQEIIATKRFILDNELLNEKYKANIRRYYMSIEDVELCGTDQEATLSD